MNSSLQDSIGSNDIVDTIIQSIHSPLWGKRIFVLLEGIDDWRIYPKFFDEAQVSFEYPGGKGQVVPALQQLNMRNIRSIGICDADFNNLLKIDPEYFNLFFTDCHDIEMMMLKANALLSIVLANYDVPDNYIAILENTLKEASYIGYIRLYNEVNIAKYRFQNLGLGRFISIDGISVSLDRSGYVNEINMRSKNKTHSLTQTIIDTFIQENTAVDLFDLCTGHDVTAIIALILGGAVSHKNFCIKLRECYELKDFKQTELYNKMTSWQTANNCRILL